ncbi:MAG: redoxin domain-containing protein [Planctomycetaceae bacterium]
MGRLFLLRGVAILLIIGLAPSSARSDSGASDAVAAEALDLDWSLPMHDGTVLRLRPSAEHRLQVICFMGCECPLAKLYAARLSQLAVEFADDQVRFVGINSNPQDSMEEIAAFAADHRLGFGIAKDHDALALASFAATRTPEVFVMDGLGQVIYRGRIDDQYRPGVIQSEPKRHDLRQAIEDFLAGRPIAVPRTEAAGCLIAKPREVDPRCDVTYCGQIAAILSQHCVECHREGEIGPFSLTSYDDAAGWADMILETIDDQRMPPWHATSDHEPLVNERSVPEEHRDLLRRWVAGGTPYGDASTLAPAPKYATGWQLGRSPDISFNVSASPVRIPAAGIVEYQYYVVQTEFEDDVWVEAAEILPGNRSVVHHAIAFIRPPDGVELEGLGMLTAYVPGQRVAGVRPGLAKRIPAGSKLVFQMHYTPTGSEQSDSSKLGLYVVDPKTVSRESITLVGINHDLEIPPHEPNVVIEGVSTHFPDNAELLAISPHMHLRGRSVSVKAEQGGTARTILEVPRYDFNWQHTYLLRNPIPLAELDAIRFEATFDNSKANPFNPDPTQFVTWGDQTWEEMAIVFYEVARPLASGSAPPTPATQTVAAAVTSKATTRHEELAKQLMSDLDRNGDGTIEYDELDLSVKWRLFRQMDANNDRIIYRDEVLDFVRLSR